AKERRAHRRAHQRALARGAAGEPRTRDRAQARLRDLLGLYPALRALAVLRLRLCLRRLPGELPLRGLRALGRGLRCALSRDARGRRHQASFRALGPLRPRRPRSRILAGRHRRDRADDRRTGGVGLNKPREKSANTIIDCIALPILVSCPRNQTGSRPWSSGSYTVSMRSSARKSRSSTIDANTKSRRVSRSRFGRRPMTTPESPSSAQKRGTTWWVWPCRGAAYAHPRSALARCKH